MNANTTSSTSFKPGHPATDVGTLAKFLSEKCPDMIGHAADGSPVEETVVECAMRLLIFYATRKPILYNMAEQVPLIGIDPDDLRDMLNSSVEFKAGEYVGAVANIALAKEPVKNGIVMADAHGNESPAQYKTIFVMQMEWDNEGEQVPKRTEGM